MSQFPQMQAKKSNSYLCLLPLVEEDEMWLSGEESPSISSLLLKRTGVLQECLSLEFTRNDFLPPSNTERNGLSGQ